jgi:hypothetical protein
MPATAAQDAWIEKLLGIDPKKGRGAAPRGNGRVFEKSRLAWTAARKQVERDLGKLGDAIAATYEGHGAAGDLELAFRAKVEAMLSTLDHSLADKLDEVNRAADAAAHTELVQEARQIIRRYEAYLAGEPMIAKLDANPFVPTAIAKTLTATLEVLGKAVR